MKKTWTCTKHSSSPVAARLPSPCWTPSSVPWVTVLLSILSSIFLRATLRGYVFGVTSVGQRDCTWRHFRWPAAMCIWRHFRWSAAMCICRHFRWSVAKCIWCHFRWSAFVEVEMNFHLEWKLRFSFAQFRLRQVHWTGMSVSIEAKYCVCWLRLVVTNWRRAEKTGLNSSFCSVTADSKSGWQHGI